MSTQMFVKVGILIPAAPLRRYRASFLYRASSCSSRFSRRDLDAFGHVIERERVKNTRPRLPRATAAGGGGVGGVSLIHSNVQENTHGGSEGASRRSTAIRPRQQPLFRGEKEGKVHRADLSDGPPGGAEILPGEDV